VAIGLAQRPGAAELLHLESDDPDTKDMERDYFMTAEEAKEYSLIDKVLAPLRVTLPKASGKVSPSRAESVLYGRASGLVSSFG
jgi:hypothetical protein